MRKTITLFGYTLVQAKDIKTSLEKCLMSTSTTGEKVLKVLLSLQYYQLV